MHMRQWSLSSFIIMYSFASFFFFFFFSTFSPSCTLTHLAILHWPTAARVQTNIGPPAEYDLCTSNSTGDVLAAWMLFYIWFDSDYKTVPQLCTKLSTAILQPHAHAHAHARTLRNLRKYGCALTTARANSAHASDYFLGTPLPPPMDASYVNRLLRPASSVVLLTCSVRAVFLLRGAAAAAAPTPPRALLSMFGTTRGNE